MHASIWLYKELAAMRALHAWLPPQRAYKAPCSAVLGSAESMRPDRPTEGSAVYLAPYASDGSHSPWILEGS